jgi:hypothetical protein
MMNSFNESSGCHLNLRLVASPAMSARHPVPPAASSRFCAQRFRRYMQASQYSVRSDNP